MTLRFERPAAYLVTQGIATPDNFPETSSQILDIIGIAVENNIALIQVRERQTTAKLLYELTSAAVEITRHSSTTLLVNDRADIAVAAGADGVHLTARSLDASTIRRAFGDKIIIGVSTHTLSEVEKAKDDGADFAVFGPVFNTPEKPSAQGIDELAKVCRTVSPFPVIGIGGIDATNLQSVIDAGAAGIAAIRALNDRKSLVRIVHQLNGT